METETRQVINFFERCRLCLEKHGKSDIFGLPELPDLVGDITLCTGIEVSSSDNLPQKICLRCLDIVVQARWLRDLATTNDKHLKFLFGNEDTDKHSSKSSTQNDNLNSSYDSDSPRLQIDEDAGKEKSKSNKRRSLEAADIDKAPKVLSVRKDLFDTTPTKSSSTEDKQPLDSINITKLPNLESLKKEQFDSKSYECEQCEKTFDAWKKYYLHQRSHNRKIICPLDACGKKFATKGDLEKHIRTHTGERPFKCNICGKGFAQRGSLKGHKETVHGHLH